MDLETCQVCLEGMAGVDFRSDLTGFAGGYGFGNLSGLFGGRGGRAF